MNYDQLASFEPALANFLEKVRHCFKRDKTFGYLQKYILGLMADLKRKSIEPIALSCGMPVRTLREFLAFFAWDHELADKVLVRQAVERQLGKRSIGVLDASAHAKQGTHKMYLVMAKMTECPLSLSGYNDRPMHRIERDSPGRVSMS